MRFQDADTGWFQSNLPMPSLVWILGPRESRVLAGSRTSQSMCGLCEAVLGSLRSRRVSSERTLLNGKHMEQPPVKTDWELSHVEVLGY